MEKTWQDLDLQHLWHPCTQMQDHEWLPLLPIVKGEGVWLYDLHGKRYLDAISSWWVNLFGHCQPYIAQKIQEQLHTLEHVILAGCSHEPAVRLARRLAEKSGLPRLFFADNGSSAVEVALKMSFQYWRNLGQERRFFVALSNSYHGETLGALALGDVGLYRDLYQPLLLERLLVPSPDAYHAEAGESRQSVAERQFLALEALLRERHQDIAAVIVEPLVQCAGGMRMHDPYYLTLLDKACKKYNVHWIADEVAVGFGRAGSFFAHQQAPQVQPDFLCLGKGLTGGFLPLAVVLTKELIYQAFYDRYDTLKAFLHSHSYAGNPLACAAANATLDIFEREPVLENNQKLAQVMWQSIAHLQEHPHVGDIRQTGMILAIEMVKDKANKTPFPWQERRGLRVYRYGLEREMFLRPLGNVSYWLPPYVITPEEITQLAQVTAAGIIKAVEE
jgi:adenosylmethionine-8-amino-7-oxononanoate aminotransferase